MSEVRCSPETNLWNLMSEEIQKDDAVEVKFAMMSSRISNHTKAKSVIKY